MATSQTFTPQSGTAGRVHVIVSSVHYIVAGISEWKRSSSSNIIPIPHFESSSHATTGLVQPNKLLGLGDNKVSLQGIYNTNATDQTEIGTTYLTNGAYITCDLFINRSSTKGYDSVVGWISNFEVTVSINNQPVAFSCTLDVDGVFPSYGTVSG